MVMGGLVRVSTRSIEVCILNYLYRKRGQPGKFAAKTNLAVHSTGFASGDLIKGIWGFAGAAAVIYR
jgi:hypothetical protein